MRSLALFALCGLTACGGGPTEFREDIGAAPKTVAAPAPEPEAKRYSAKTFFETTSVFGASFSADGRTLLFTSDEGGVYNVWSIPVAGGKATQRTMSTSDARFSQGYFPKDNRFLYTGDQGGNEQTHLYVRNLDGSERDLTPGEKLKASFGGFSRDGKHFYVWTNEREPKFFDLYRYRSDTYKRKRVFTNTKGWSPGTVDPKGRYVAVGSVRNNADSDIYLINLKKPKAKPVHITKHEGNATHSPLQFSPDGKALVYLTNAHGEFQQAWTYDLGAKTHAAFVKRDWDVRYVAYSWDGKYYLVSINEDAKSKIEMFESSTDTAVPMPDLPVGDVRSLHINRAEDRLAIYVSGDREPSNLYTLEVGDSSAVKLTETKNPEMNLDDLVDTEVIRFASYDGMKIPSILYKPKGASAAKPVPAVVFAHGGPGGQSRRGYSAVLQYVVNHGYAMLLVNNRGSSGYGKTFFHLDDKKHGDVDLKDFIAGRTYLEGLDWVDGKKVAIMGGSYGGYIVAAALAFHPEAFELGINIFGVTNWVRTLENIPPWWSAFREALYAELGNPETDKERLTAISPLFHAQNIKRPLLVVQGANDPRVLKVESDEIVAAVRANGVPVEYVLFEDEGHGFRKKKNRITAAEAYVKFLDRHLLGKGAIVVVPKPTATPDTGASAPENAPPTADEKPVAPPAGQQK